MREEERERVREEERKRIKIEEERSKKRGQKGKHEIVPLIP